MQVTRRGVLVGVAAAGGLAALYTLAPRDYAIPLDPADGETAFDAWIKIATDGMVTVAVPQLEMGQGVTTLIPQIVAMELGADWRQIAVQAAPVSGAYANTVLAAEWAPLWIPFAGGLVEDADDFLVRRFAGNERFTATAGGTSLAAYEQPCRDAAASVRALLCMAAADRWGVDWEECRTENGFVIHDAERLRFGDLAEEAAGFARPDPPPVFSEPPADTPAVPSGPGFGEETNAWPRLDLPAKVDGTWQFAGDVRLPGLVYAAIKHGPLDKAELTAFNRSAAADMRGVVGIVEGKRWLAAVAETSWLAERAVEAMSPRFSVMRLVDSEAIAVALSDAELNGTGTVVATRGQGAEGFGKTDLALRYEIAPALHGQIEPTTATAWYRDGTLELWLASQAPEQARRAAAKAAGVALEDTILYPMPAGGSFDRRLEHGHAIEAAVIAREIGRPVQLVWSRFQEHLAGYPRTPASLLLSARHGDEGTITKLKMRASLPATAREFGERLFGNATSWSAIENTAGEADPMALAGAMPPYAIPDVSITHVPAAIDLPTARMRGNAHGYTCFAIESFIDELARRHDRDPLSYRMALLGQDLRLAECMQRASRLAAWDGGSAGSGQGLACHVIGGARIAAIANAQPGEGGVRVKSIHAAVDIGRVVNRDIARQQVEGGLVFGIGLAVGCSTDYRDGLPTSQRLGDLNLPTLADSPEITVDFVDSTLPPADPGEIGVAVAAPAIANALFSATGLRLRRLPLLSAGL